ncbi:hypothetical protein POM88_031860 [Heracleum sosnowskyi]|uniref:Uncharacterized protein n=1 Tax=Heracleum sosnowskyi TaxID=360622 RepID=A0AAD8HY83_9APIA|nr:hypothetical protein POM88_031860 [Heracleum sosnowskyi]
MILENWFAKFLPGLSAHKKRSQCLTSKLFLKTINLKKKIGLVQMLTTVCLNRNCLTGPVPPILSIHRSHMEGRTNGSGIGRFRVDSWSCSLANVTELYTETVVSLYVVPNHLQSLLEPLVLCKAVVIFSNTCSLCLQILDSKTGC